MYEDKIADNSWRYRTTNSMRRFVAISSRRSDKKVANRKNRQLSLCTVDVNTTIKDDINGGQCLLKETPPILNVCADLKMHLLLLYCSFTFDIFCPCLEIIGARVLKESSLVQKFNITP